MRHFYLIANTSKSGTREAAKWIQEYLVRNGATCELAPLQTGEVPMGYTDPDQVPADTECVITLGGDGTLIQAARDLVAKKLPFIGINMGHLGYLTQASGDENLAPCLDALLGDDFWLQRRMMLEGRVISADGTESGIALNDIVLARKDVLQLLKFQLYVNGEFLNEYKADGMIVATPTGSTAYNLSAGGPIVTPAAELMILTPICSHALNSSSIILSPGDRVSIRLTGCAQQTAVFDGDQILPIREGDTLEICRSKCYVTLIQLQNVSFLENLRNKMTLV